MRVIDDENSSKSRTDNNMFWLKIRTLLMRADFREITFG